MSKTRRQYKSKEEKMYVMKGCSKGSRSNASRRQNKKTSRRPKCVTRQKSLMRKQSLQRGIMQNIGFAGGNCTTCQPLNGGSANSLVGSPWSATNGQAQPPSNHYAQNMYTTDPQMMMQVRGGKGSRGKGSRGKGSRGKKRRGLKGGVGLMSLVPADLVNLGRDLSFNANSAYSSLTGATQPVNPNVTEQQLNTTVNLHKILV
jgi:hypothetical protein